MLVYVQKAANEPLGSCGWSDGSNLDIQGVANRSGEFRGRSASHETDKNELRMLGDGVIPNRYQVQAVRAECLEHALKLFCGGNDLALNHCRLIGSGEYSRRTGAHFFGERCVVQNAYLADGRAIDPVRDGAFHRQDRIDRTAI